MTLDSDDPNFQIDMGFVDLYIGQVNVVADITQNHFVRQRTPIPFDEEIFDPTNSFFPENSTFVAPWTGSFKFYKENFRYDDISIISHLFRIRVRAHGGYEHITTWYIA